MTFLDVCVMCSAVLPWMIVISLTERRRKVNVRIVEVSSLHSETSHMWRWRTLVNVGVESQGAVLYVEGEGVDVKVTGADHLDRESIVQHPITVQVHVWDFGGSVFIHAISQSRVSQNMLYFKYVASKQGIRLLWPWVFTHNSLMTMSGAQNLVLGREILFVPHWTGSQVTNSFFHH